MAGAAAGCTDNTILPPKTQTAGFAPWTVEAPVYRVGIADDLEIKFGFNAEFNDRVIVGPDGPLHHDADRLGPSRGPDGRRHHGELEQRFSRELRRPRAQVLVRNYGSQRIFVGGEVNNSGTYALPRPIGILEAILMANGFRDTARKSEVVLIRRAATTGRCSEPSTWPSSSPAPKPTCL
ncbi:MAG: SLBB domain-containing protein [Pseudomonadota bacterium]